MNPRIEEKHLSLFEPQHERLKKMAKAEGRTMRGMVEVLMNEHEEKKNDRSGTD